MSTEDPLVNNGERLYYKNLAHGVLRQSKIEETKKNDEDNFTMEFRFQPRITKVENDKYSNIPSKFRESIPTQKFEEEQIVKDKKETEPKTEEEIKKMTNRLHSELQKFKENKEKLKKEQTKEECPFTPTINVQGKPDPKFFMMRLEKWKKKMEEKNKNNEGSERKMNIDSMTGQKLFQPKVVDPVAKKLKRENEDVHMDLYKKGLEHIDYRKKITKPDTRDNLEQIEREKKEKINKLKEERERYKKEKQEKMEKEIQERTLKAKAEKENMEKIIKERYDREYKEKEEDKKSKSEKKDLKNKAKEKKTENNLKKEAASKKNKNQKETKIENNKTNKKKDLKDKRANTESAKLKSAKDNIKKLPVKKGEKSERAKSQISQKKKNPIIEEKETKTKTINVDSKNKNKKKLNIPNKNEKIGQIEYNNTNKNKKGNLKSKEVAIEFNVVSKGSKSKTIKKAVKK